MNNITRVKTGKKKPLDINVITNEIQKITKDNSKYITKTDMLDLMKVINSHDIKIKTLGESIKKMHQPPVETIKRKSSTPTNNESVENKLAKLENLIKLKTKGIKSKQKVKSIAKHKSKNEESDDSMSSDNSTSDDSDCEDSVYKL